MSLANETRIAEPQGLRRMTKPMTAKSKSNTNRPPGASLPDNLTAWFSERQLLSIVLDAVQTVELPPTTAPSSNERRLRPSMMLTLLTFCYATDRLGSEDVVRSLGENTTVRYICAHHYPKWNDLRLFRRHRRDELRRCLVQVYQQAWAARFEEGQTSFESLEWFEQELRGDIERLVDRKLEQAIMLDWANLED